MEIKNQHFSEQKIIFRICHKIFLWEQEGSQWVLNCTEGCCGILMVPSSIEMVIKALKHCLSILISAVVLERTLAQCNPAGFFQI